MPPRTILEERFLAEDDDNLNDYNDWSARDAAWAVDDSFVFDSRLFRTDTAGAYSWINTLPRHLYPDHAYGISYGFTFYNDNVTDYDHSLVFGATQDTSKNDWWQSGVRVRILKYSHTNDNARIRIYNQNVVVVDENINFTTDTTQAYTFTTFEPDGTGYTLFTQEGKGFTYQFDIGQPFDFSGLYYGSITNRNGQQSGAARCSSSCDLIEIVEYPMGDYVVGGLVTLRNLIQPGARLTCVSQADDSVCLRQTADSDGRYLFEGLDPYERYDLMATYKSGNSYFTSLCRSGVTPIFVPDN